MNVAVIGKGGREHAIVRALSLSPSVQEIIAIPGSEGMEEAKSISADTSDFDRVIEVCRAENIELVVIGPENELCAGLADYLRSAGLAVFGPNREAAQLEASKVFSKEFMQRHGLPTAPHIVVSSLEDINKSIDQFRPPYVLKADGLAAGKGVFICKDRQELEEAGKFLWEKNGLGEAGQRALLEQFQEGYEVSFFILTNGKEYQALPMAQDHKRLLDQDAGPNTGGMGTVAPLELDKNLVDQIIQNVVEPTVLGFQKEGFVYRGVVFIGLMMTSEGPSVLEYNVRFGDPETQVLLPLLDGDWGKVFYEIACDRVPPLNWHTQKAAACVVLAAENYPQSTPGGVPISGLGPMTATQYVLHAGTQMKEGQWATNGGRVLNVIGEGKDIPSALEESYSRLRTISWSGMRFRSDIGKQFHQVKL